MLRNLLFVDYMTTEEEFEMCLKQMSDAKKFGMINEFISRADELLTETKDISKAMYSAWYDLFINSDTGKYLDKFQSMLPKPGKNTTS
jgi:hypothetical protein